MSKPDHNPVSAPAHYTRLTPEPLDVIEAWGLDFHRGQVVKYVARAGYKTDEMEDLRKARFYLDRLIAKLAVEEGVPPGPAMAAGPLTDALKAAFPVSVIERMANTLRTYPPQPEPRPSDNPRCEDRSEKFDFQPGDCATATDEDDSWRWEDEACVSCRQYYGLGDSPVIATDNVGCTDRGRYKPHQMGDCSTCDDAPECPWHTVACDSCRAFYGIDAKASS